MKSIWTGSIGFGLVNIPVKMYSATAESSLDLDMLDKKDLSNIRFMRVNAKTGKEVKWENIIKGYNLNGRYVLLNDKDFENASPEKTKEIKITQFVHETEIDSIYYEMPYYLEPEKNGVRPYELLRDSLKKTGKAGLGSFVMRNREHLLIIKASGNVIIANRIRFMEEIRKPELKIPNARSNPKELKMATALINQLTKPFNIAKFKDTYTSALLKTIKNKAKGKQTEPKPLRVVHSQTRDLMDQLKASIEETGKKRKAS
ncbi:MAG TPA: Ku protein [Puia sp.]